MTSQRTPDAEQMARRAATSDRLATAARAGFAVNGVMHLLIGWIALQVALGSSDKGADPSGALATLAGHGLGRALLWIGVVGFTGLALWQLGTAVTARGDGSDRARVIAEGVVKALVYAALAVTTLRFARGGGSSSSSTTQSQDATAAIMAHDGGRAAVVLVGVVVVGVGVHHVVKGLRRAFLRDLVEHPGTVVTGLGVAGYAAKGVALVVVGLLFAVAGLQRQPEEATGLDGALQTLREQPFGPVLLVVVAPGIIAYGAYSLARARYARL